MPTRWPCNASARLRRERRNERSAGPTQASSLPLDETSRRPKGAPVSEAPASMRLDKWLWAARFYKTRALAVDEINLGRVRVGGVPVKPARDVKVGDVLTLRIGQMTREIEVKGLSSHLSRQTPSSRAARPSRTAAAWRTGTGGQPPWTMTTRVDPDNSFRNPPLETRASRLMSTRSPPFLP
jgi:ribosomal 50S subunit-recycling heat shock protein